MTHESKKSWAEHSWLRQEVLECIEWLLYHFQTCFTSVYERRSYMSWWLTGKSRAVSSASLPIFWCIDAVRKHVSRSRVSKVIQNGHKHNHAARVNQLPDSEDLEVGFRPFELGRATTCREGALV